MVGYKTSKFVSGEYSMATKKKTAPTKKAAKNNKDLGGGSANSTRGSELDGGGKGGRQVKASIAKKTPAKKTAAKKKK
jgi:hypothetical protein